MQIFERQAWGTSGFEVSGLQVPARENSRKPCTGLLRAHWGARKHCIGLHRPAQGKLGCSKCCTGLLRAHFEAQKWCTSLLKAHLEAEKCCTGLLRHTWRPENAAQAAQGAHGSSKVLHRHAQAHLEVQKCCTGLLRAHLKA